MDFVDYIQKNCEKWYIDVKIIPNSKITDFSELMWDGRIKIKISAIAEKNKANKELLSFLKNELRLKKDCINIISGEHSQNKRISVRFESK